MAQKYSGHYHDFQWFSSIFKFCTSEKAPIIRYEDFSVQCFFFFSKQFGYFFYKLRNFWEENFDLYLTEQKQ